jgi:hypothetical protein
MKHPTTIGSVRRQHAGGFVFSYTIVGHYRTLNKQGKPTKLIELRGTCAVCGEPFYITEKPKLGRYLTRTCEAHRRAPRSEYVFVRKPIRKKPKAAPDSKPAVRRRGQRRHA